MAWVNSERAVTEVPGGERIALHAAAGEATDPNRLGFQPLAILPGSGTQRRVGRVCSQWGFGPRQRGRPAGVTQALGIVSWSEAFPLPCSENGNERDAMIPTHGVPWVRRPW